MAALSALGYAVQLEHDGAGAEKHHVELLVGGVSKAKSPELQHNKNYRQNEQMSKALVAEFQAAMKA